MVRFSIASLLAVCASVAAAQSNVTTTAELLAGIAYVQRDTQNLTTQLSGPINTDTIYDIELAALNLTSVLAMTAAAAQALPNAVPETDQVEVLQAIEGLYPYVIQSLGLYVPNKAKLDDLIGDGLPESIIQGFQNSSATLAAALISRATGPYVAIGKELALDFNNAFESALSVVVPVAVPLPTIPPAGGSITTSSSTGVSTLTPNPTPTSSAPFSAGPSAASSLASPIMSSVPVYSGSGAAPTYPVYGSTTECTTAPVYGSSSAPSYGGGIPPVYRGSSIPVYSGGSAPTAPVYGQSTGAVQLSSPAATGPAVSYYHGTAGRNVAHLGAAVMAAGVAVLV